MSLGFKVSGRIAKPVHEVFDAVVNPKKLSGYFTTLGGASAPLVAGTTVTWWGSVPVEVDEIELDKRIVLRWDAEAAEGQPAYKTRIEMGFDVLEDGSTFVTIGESGWVEDAVGRKASYGNCEGWAEMLSAMKAWLEYGINLRKGFYPSEMRGQLPTTSERK
ncbi:ATPase [Aminobacter sp. Y103A]|uniref:SRPBCC domain-containing protein n=1 Tax=Aminobacter sp. Y103A TaxID=1870862 RepID=UPI00257243A7|nr:SRPBCC domain-containing protein [Aminobacter sp. SS-2016]BBD40018.1 ATPase [Aminobacter sp. SS-2016]